MADLNEQAQSRLELIIEQMKAAEGVTENMKATDQMAWVGAMNSIRNRAEEIVTNELVQGDTSPSFPFFINNILQIYRENHDFVI